MQLSIKTNFPDVQRQLSKLHADLVGPVTARAINRTLEQGRTQVVRSITAEYNVKAKDVRDTLRIDKATVKGGRFMVSGFLESKTKRGRSVNMIRFGARQTKQGVTVKIKRGGPRHLITGAFIANRDNSAGGTVFVRKGKARLPIQGKTTIGMPQMFNARKVKKVVVRLLETKFPEIFEREAKFYTERFNRRKAGI